MADKDNENSQRDNKEEILDSIKESEMDVMAQLGVARLNLDDIYNLRVGDVIDLNKPQDSTVSVYVEEQPWFTGKLGVHNKNIAVKIEEVEKKKK